MMTATHRSMFTLKEKLERKVAKLPMTWSECTQKNNPLLSAETVKELQDKADSARVGQRAEVKRQRMEEFERSKQEPKARGRPSALRTTEKSSASKGKEKAESTRKVHFKEDCSLESPSPLSPSPGPSDEDDDDDKEDTGVSKEPMPEKNAAAPTKIKKPEVKTVARAKETKVDIDKAKRAASLVMAGYIAGSRAKEMEKKTSEKDAEDGKKKLRSSASRPKSQNEKPPATVSVPDPAKKNKDKMSEKDDDLVKKKAKMMEKGEEPVKKKAKMSEKDGECVKKKAKMSEKDDECVKKKAKMSEKEEEPVKKKAKSSGKKEEPMNTKKNKEKLSEKEEESVKKKAKISGKEDPEKKETEKTKQLKDQNSKEAKKTVSKTDWKITAAAAIMSMAKPSDPNSGKSTVRKKTVPAKELGVGEQSQPSKPSAVAMAKRRAVSKEEPAEKINNTSDAESDTTLDFGTTTKRPQPVTGENSSEEGIEENEVESKEELQVVAKKNVESEEEMESEKDERCEEKDESDEEKEAEAEASDNCCVQN